MRLFFDSGKLNIGKNAGEHSGMKTFSWTQYPQQKAETRIDITKIPLLEKLKHLLNIGK